MIYQEGAFGKQQLSSTAPFACSVEVNRARSYIISILKKKFLSN